MINTEPEDEKRRLDREIAGGGSDVPCWESGSVLQMFFPLKTTKYTQT